MIKEPELKETIGDFHLSMKELRESIRDLRLFQNETSEQMKNTDEQIKNTSEQQKKTDEQMKKTDIRLNKMFKESDARFDKMFKESSESLDKIGKMVGSISNNQGDVAEEFFFNTLRIKKKIGNIEFDDITSNLFKERDRIKDEYDILLTNDDSIAIVEIKYKAHLNDVEKLKTKKIPNFQKLFPLYKDYKIYAGIASFHINQDVVKKAEEYGFFILKRHGKLVEAETEFMVDQREVTD